MQLLLVLTIGVAHQRIGGIENRLHGPVVLFERDHLRRRREALRKLQDVLHAGGAEGIDRLRIVADDTDAGACRFHGEQDLGLQRVRVLVLVDQHMIEAFADIACQLRFLHQHMPVQQQIVVVEQLLCLLGLDVAPEQAREFVAPLGTPGEGIVERLLQRLSCVDAMRIDGKAGVLAGKTFLLARQSQILPQVIDQVGSIAAIDHGERGIEAERVRVLAQQAIADRVKRARPQKARGVRMKRSAPRLLAQRFIGDGLGPSQHFLRRAPRECQQQDALGRDAIEQQVRNAMRQRIGLAGAGTGDDQQRIGLDPARRDAAERRCAQLFRVESVAEGRCRGVELRIHAQRS